MLPRKVDAVVIGSGPNGLVSAVELADAGWDVLVLEAADTFGGAVQSTESDGWISDRYSSNYPLGLASPVLRALELEQFGLRWAHAELPLAHLLDPDTSAAIHPDPKDTAASVSADHPGDGEAWLELYSAFVKIREPFLESLLTGWPPLLPAARLTRRLGSAGELVRFARFMAMPMHRMAQELFDGPRARALLAGNAFHADAPLSGSVSGTMGWLLAMLAQDVGYPVVEGGSSGLTGALRRRAERAGALFVAGTPVTGIELTANRATAVRTASGERVAVGRAVVADVSAPTLYDVLLPQASVPAGLRRDLERFEWDYPTVKVNYRLSGPIPWRSEQARVAGVVHLGGTADDLVHTSADLDTGRMPAAPFLLIGQTTKSDPTRSPAGTEAVWAYSHLPRGTADDASAEKLGDQMDRLIDRYAPGFSALVIDRDLQRPGDLLEANASLALGALGGGTAQLHQQLIFRPTIGLGSPRTYVTGLYLGSSAVHPGPGVHGACGHLAARTALRDASLLGPVTRALPTAALRRLQR
ncbi:FAD dependent oxidoreductase [Kribbella flavida DSM 17836]|uniref:Pyridine nucleotide-disulfide oxidoreductase domain-containing protein 2 n=1 Tax=Kribbella flavida (strain DSM 17836 / JCM 10339 / NBRC 14399) TaxID=479435 RepID=D2PXX4_KRIFD|nr:NAD(P)/FAD-dependent oxidoreductase [Kribbella flavida]ADB33580.1 FAD dependent oxidoreductase [Kribbella flavida DSM 17836]